MQQNVESKISAIDAQIQKLQEKKKREINKLQKNVGKKFLSTFNLEDKPISEINAFIDNLKYDKENHE
ncbi:hypothetical protein [Virgibacillus sp. Bac332]|uniref:hypothetical protein n=1 Tax=Virgibacillus sp. Bac332 TaxID=2419842 RepID=UPI000EF4D580|nr:hypothetical protein [Virgibacillus sp. Bac332]